MLPKAHLTSHSRMSGSRWVITPLWLSGSLRSFLYSSSLCSCHRFLISSAFVSPYCFCPLLCPFLHELWCWRKLESPLDWKEIKPVNLKGNQPWIFIGRTDAEAEIPILWPPDARNWLIGKVPDAGKDWRQEDKGWQRMRWLDGITDSSTWVWASSGSWWWTGKPGVLQSIGLQIVGHGCATELTELTCMNCSLGVSNFLEISTLSHSIVFLFFFALIT